MADWGDDNVQEGEEEDGSEDFELPEEEEGAGSQQNHGSDEERSSSSGNEEGSSSGEENQGDGDDPVEIQDDLFGPDNEDYMRTTPQSQLPIPILPEPRNDQRNDHEYRRGNPRGERNSSFYSGGFKSKDLVADLKLGPPGHLDETLRIACPPFQEPNQICCYSRTPDGTVYYDERCLRKFRRRVLSSFEADLNEGFDSFVQKNDDSESSAFGDLLACVRTKLTSFKDIHFVTFRNNLNKILGTTYSRRDAWEMGVHKRSGTVYLDCRKTPEPPQTELQQRQCYWGYKYEEVATENPQRDLYEMSGDAGPPVAVDANVEFCTVVRTKLGPHRIIMGAEIDCYDVGSDGTKRYTELKTSRELDKRSFERFEKEKLLKFWIQSFLVGVPRIVCGFRDDNGRLLRSDMMLTQEIARKMKQKHYWEGGVCLAFADRVLCWLYGSVNDGGDYTLRYIPNSNRIELVNCDSCPRVISEHIELLESSS
ncbi:decapping nuclease DXO homolog, chloroplastic [Selaginella moellendorffii]|uniref:decapping nuclease DXO homolog, chloroplastic n=1 Tax=Selaginella moellendorffii TaxID=88036 RepID=UPI000D1C499B|nr:decapping nuclease DXO homolog, chloroplastic [Selaginella moellendorffii]|eukprot:XP_002991233.2 decapping nuclease DXO homolog, chloroplastic [Selaginella moellendorffii]